MSRFWFDTITGDNGLRHIPDAVTYYKSELDDAMKETEIKGSFAKLSSELPGIMAYRFGQLQELEAILEYIDILRDQARQRAFKMYLENYAKSLSSRDAEKYAGADQTVYEYSLLYNQINLLKQKFLGITKGLESKHYNLGYLAKLKEAGMEDYYIG